MSANFTAVDDHVDSVIYDCSTCTSVFEINETLAEVMATTSTQPVLGAQIVPFGFAKEGVVDFVIIGPANPGAIIAAANDFAWPAGSIPLGYRPGNPVSVPIVVQNGGVHDIASLTMNPDGSMILHNDAAWADAMLILESAAPYVV